jgi:hypothetical protein
MKKIAKSKKGVVVVFVKPIWHLLKLGAYPSAETDKPVPYFQLSAGTKSKFFQQV